MTVSEWTQRADGSRAVAIEILRHGPISRSAIARRLNLSAGSLTRLSKPLLEAGLVREVGDINDGRVGRPQQLLEVDAGARRFVGIKLGPDNLVAACTNLRGEVLEELTLRLAMRTPEAVTAVIATAVQQLASGHRIDGVGIGLGGVVIGQTTVRHSPYLGWTDVPLARLVSQATDIPTLIDNDVVAFTEYEHWFGAGRDLDRFAVVTLGVGIGYGLMVRGQQVVDDDYGIGLVNHWPLDQNGPMCPLGHRGCATSLLNSDAIATRTSAALARTVDIEAVLDLAESGQPAARTIVDEAGRGLGRLLAAIGNLTLPQLIIIAGEAVRLAGVAGDALAMGMAADRPAGASPIPLLLASGDNVEWSRGAAVLAIQSYVRGEHPEAG